jgi:hypothetical protein
VRFTRMNPELHATTAAVTPVTHGSGMPLRATILFVACLNPAHRRIWQHGVPPNRMSP